MSFSLKRFSFISTLAISLLSLGCTAQTINIKGSVTNIAGSTNLYQVIVVNARTSEGTLSPTGKFEIKVLQSDTILFSASGFAVKKVCFHDSAPKAEYNVTIKLDSLQINLAEVSVHPVKSLRQIDEDKTQLGVKNNDRYKDAHLLTNPISALYERFSRMEQSKREVAQLEDEAERRQVLKDLLHLYVKYDIINLDDKQFDAFIDFMKLSDDFIKNSTDYDLLMAIKYKYEVFSNANSYYIPKPKN